MSFSFPNCWSDDQIMNFRFQSFNDRHSNPLAYDAKMNFWKALIMELSHSNLLKKRDGGVGALTLTHQMLCDVFTRKGETPKCLGTVLKELQKEKHLTEYEAYRHGLEEASRRQEASWPYWGYDVLVASPLKKLVSVVSPKKANLDSSCYVVNTNVKQTALKLLKLVHRQADSGCVGADYRLILSHKDVLNLSQVDNEDLDLLLLWLESEKLVKHILIESSDTVYKFARSANEKVQNLTEIEQGVLQIQATKLQLETSVANRQLKIEQYISECKSIVNKNRKLALRILRKKKTLEKSIDREEQHIHKLECILDEICLSSTSQLVVNAYGKGVAALKSLTDACPIDHVNSTMDELSDMLAASADINEAISTPLPATDDDSELLEQELESLLTKEISSTKRKSLDNELYRVNSLSVADTVLEETRTKNSRYKMLAS
ncbi:charged multivesicular body protein 7-like [Watersipora subatra]|uniref:charged multivesicular body protein 7-like n=1 Tax=Watersipora subatra TaxID=2589382 RepID=UPI00355C37C5